VPNNLGVLTTKVFAKAGQDNVTSAICKHQQQFQLDVQFSAFVFLYINIFSTGGIGTGEGITNTSKYPFHE
jgi:hypothetical protein